MNGTLEDTTPAGVLQVLSSQGSTGAVRFLGDSGCTVYLHRGELYFAENPETAEDLAMALVRPGRLSADEWDASTEAGYPTETVGEKLVETGSITRELLASVVLSVIYDPLIQLFRAPEGDYEFAPDVVHWMGPYRTFSVDAIVSEVRRRTREADEMAPVVPSLDAIVRSARTLPETHGSVNLRRDDWEVVVAAASGCSVSDLAAELGRGRWSTARIVYRLATADLLMVTPVSEPVTEQEQVSPSPTFGFEVGDGPPPLDDSVLDSAPDAPVTAPADPWATSEAAFEMGPASQWGAPDTEARAETEPDVPTDDPWGEFDTTAGGEDSWDPNALYGQSPTSSEVSTEDAPANAGVADAAPDSDIDFEPPALHPDIAKALAESTYADSATAINAMAARLGAIEADDDDDDDWNTDAEAGGEGGEFWSGAEGGTGAQDFIWKPAAWDTNVESVPLPQRGGTRVASPPTQASSGDPAWLDNLYSEFMPGGEPASTGTDSGADAPTPDPDAAPKQRTLRRLMSAIRRL